MNAPIRTLILTTLLAGLSSVAGAQSKGAIEKKLAAEYTVTQATADQTDIVTAGSILVLKKGDIMMAPVSGTNYYQNTYKDGRITQNAAGKISKKLDRFSHLGLPGVPAAPVAAPATRTFVPGEKVWVTKIECKDDGVVFDLFTDAFADVRYKAALKFYFSSKGPIPEADEVDKLVGEVFKIQPPDSGDGAAAGGGQQQQAAPAAAPAAPPPAPEAALAPIPPPPPPADAPEAPPKELKIGQTKDEVVANFGQPDKIVKLGPKEIYYYKDLGKVTFVSGKVTDVQ